MKYLANDMHFWLKYTYQRFWAWKWTLNRYFCCHLEYLTHGLSKSGCRYFNISLNIFLSSIASCIWYSLVILLTVRYLRLMWCMVQLGKAPLSTVYPKKYAHGFCFAVLCCGYTLTDFPISIRLTSLALWQSNDCPSASKATLMNMDKYFMWIHYERLHNHNKAKHKKTVCIFLGIYCKPILTKWSVDYSELVGWEF